MFFISRKHRLIETEFFKGLKDYHSHILAGVDDGLQGLDSSLEALNYFEELGITEATLTPHVMAGVNPNNEDIIRAFEELKDAYKGDIKLALASEYMLDSCFESQYNAKSNIRHIHSNKLLVETSYVSGPMKLNELLYNITQDGITPIIAHPERYSYMKRTKYHALKDCEYLLQLNILSYTDYYGAGPTADAIYLLENNMYDFIGTDLHNTKVFKDRLNTIKLSVKHIDKLLELKERSNSAR